MKYYVIDASVACRFLLVEDLSDEAERVLEDFLEGSVDLVAPEIVLYEVGNALWKAVRLQLLELEQALEKYSYFHGLGLASIQLTRKEHGETLRWGAERDATYYDSAYVISTRRTGATLLTADDNLHEKARMEVATLHLRKYG